MKAKSISCFVAGLLLGAGYGTWYAAGPAITLDFAAEQMLTSSLYSRTLKLRLSAVPKGAEKPPR